MVRRFWRMVVMNEAKIMMLLCLAIGVVLMTGCASRTGWEFRIGVAPVTAVDNSSKLEQDENVKGAR